VEDLGPVLLQLSKTSVDAECVACSALLRHANAEVRQRAFSILEHRLIWRAWVAKLWHSTTTAITQAAWRSSLGIEARCFLLATCGGSEFIDHVSECDLTDIRRVRLLGRCTDKRARHMLCDVFYDEGMSAGIRSEAAKFLARDQFWPAISALQGDDVLTDITVCCALAAAGDANARELLKQRLHSRDSEHQDEMFRKAVDTYTDFVGILDEKWRERILDQL
jgi:hypothetical protein